VENRAFFGFLTLFCRCFLRYFRYNN